MLLLSIATGSCIRCGTSAYACRQVLFISRRCRRRRRSSNNSENKNNSNNNINSISSNSNSSSSSSSSSSPFAATSSLRLASYLYLKKVRVWLLEVAVLACVCC